ncbi:MAG: hypothetical protein KGI80_03895 [Verrucomicrobiota bacterium]|nr:hypothetical protein [Verrucomicrobiota bacterium]
MQSLSAFFLLALVFSNLGVGQVSNDEAFFLRRIAEFWEEGEKPLAKKQMEQFLEGYPESAYAEQIRLSLASLFVCEKEYEIALQHYNAITSPDLKGEALKGRLHCLYSLQYWEELSLLAEKSEAPWFLALSLYNQVLSTSDPILRKALAQKALPYFHSLMQESPSLEIGRSYAWLTAFLGDSAQAVKLYQAMAESYPEVREELLLQAALCEKEEEALSSFSRLMKCEGKWGKEAAYHRLRLLFAQRKFRELFSEKEELLSLLSEEHLGEAYLFLRYADALLLGEKREWDAAREAFLSLEEGVLASHARLERIDLELSAENYSLARELGISFAENFPEDPLLFSVWQRIIAASERVGEDLCSDLEKLLSSPFSLQEKAPFRFLYAKMLYDRGEKEAASLAIEPFLVQKELFSEEGNGWLLLALSHAEEKELFCDYAEKGLALGGDLCDPIALALALYNAYWERSLFSLGAEHLFRAFLLGAPLCEENTLFLGDYFLQKDPERAERLFSSLPNCERALYHLVLLAQEKGEGVLERLEALEALYLREPGPWHLRDEGEFLLAEIYVREEREELALPLLQRLLSAEGVSRGALQKSRLLMAQLLIKRGEKEEAALLLKTLMVQRELTLEPLHFEAALAYVDLMAEELSKRLSLLEGIYREWSSVQDLLAKDYQAARSLLPEKDRIYTLYMQQIEEEILQIRSLLSQDGRESASSLCNESL